MVVREEGLRKDLLDVSQQWWQALLGLSLGRTSVVMPEVSVMEQMRPCRVGWPLTLQCMVWVCSDSPEAACPAQMSGLGPRLVLTWELLWWHPRKLGLGKCSASDPESGNAPAASLVRGFNPLSSSVVCN